MRRRLVAELLVGSIPSFRSKAHNPSVIFLFHLLGRSVPLAFARRAVSSAPLPAATWLVLRRSLWDYLDSVDRRQCSTGVSVRLLMDTCS